MKKVLFGILSIIMLIHVACAVNAGVNHEQNAAPASAEENIIENSIAPGNKVDLVLFTGQSNMLGRDKELYETEIPEGKAFWYSYADEALYPMQNPVGETSLGFSKSSGSSMIPEFCAHYVKQTGRTIVCVLLANGGVPISYFSPERTAIVGMQRYLNNCQNWLEKNGYAIEHRFYVMLQGESDSADPINEHYAEDMLAFHNALKGFFDYEFGALVLNGGGIGKDEAGVKVINDAKITLAREKEDIIIASSLIPLNFFTDPTWVYDDSLNIHLTKDAIQLVGADVADNVVRYMEDKSDPVEYLQIP